MASPSSAANDKTVNKVALCSAIFAGFAYVGYSVVRTAFTRNIPGRREGEYSEHLRPHGRIYFRRLSQTTQTDVLLGEIDAADGIPGKPGRGRVILRPLSVQERIRELNLRARQFADTMLAIQGHHGHPHVHHFYHHHPTHGPTHHFVGIGGMGPSPRHTPLPGPRSLQCSPWNSPRILSPVDVRHFINSRSTENLALVPGGGGSVVVVSADAIGIGGTTPVGSPLRRRRGNRRTPGGGVSPEPGSSAASASGGDEAEDERREEAERVLEQLGGEDEVGDHLDGLVLGGRPLTEAEAKSLVSLLYTNDENLLERAIVTLGNCATNQPNQDKLRDSGCIMRLTNLSAHQRRRIRAAAVTAIGNLSLNKDCQGELRGTIPLLSSLVGLGLGPTLPFEGEFSDEESADGSLSTTSSIIDDKQVAITSLQALANMAVLEDCHEELLPLLHAIYGLLDNIDRNDDAHTAKVAALRLLVNMSCNADAVPSMLAAQAPRRLIYLLDPATSHLDILLRTVSLLANLTTCARRTSLDPAIDLPPEDKAASPDTMYAAIYGVNNIDRMRSRAFVLMNQHENEDVRVQARRLYECLKTAADETPQKPA